MEFITFPSKEEALKVAELLVKERLAACCQVFGPVESLYRWKGKVERDTEWVLTVKTKGSLYCELEALVREVHPYEVPQIVALPIVKGYSQYLKWIEGEVK